jgi:hypothetical protein
MPPLVAPAVRKRNLLAKRFGRAFMACGSYWIQTARSLLGYEVYVVEDSVRLGSRTAFGECSVDSTSGVVITAAPDQKPLRFRAKVKSVGNALREESEVTGAQVMFDVSDGRDDIPFDDVHRFVVIAMDMKRTGANGVAGCFDDHESALCIL